MLSQPRTSSANTLPSTVGRFRELVALSVVRVLDLSLFSTRKTWYINGSLSRFKHGVIASNDWILHRKAMQLDEVGRRLRERRELRSLTQADVARALGISPQAVSKWERGENAPDIALLCDLSRLLDTSVDWILGKYEAMANEFSATVFVSSVPGFTARSETLPATQVALWVNGFFQQITEAVLHEGGIPVKYMGDSLLAFFAGDAAPRRAIAAAITARAAMADPVVIGLAEGPIYLTPIGHSAHARADIMGATVNRAVRVLGWLGNAPRRIGIAGVQSESLTRDFEVVEHQAVTLKGLPEPICIVEVTGKRSIGSA